MIFECLEKVDVLGFKSFISLFLAFRESRELSCFYSVYFMRNRRKKKRTLVSGEVCHCWQRMVTVNMTSHAIANGIAAMARITRQLSEPVMRMCVFFMVVVLC